MTNSRFSIHSAWLTAKNIPDDWRASILTSGLLGDNYISLTPGFSDHYFKAGDKIALENTNKAIVLEELVSKFVANKASGLDEDTKKTETEATPLGEHHAH